MADTIFYSPDIKETLRLPETESQHCAKVLRMKEGEKTTVTDGRGSFYDCTLLTTHPKHCFLNIDAERIQEKTWNFYLHIAFAPTKNIDRNEWFVEKATEMGTDRFTPLRCDFSERKELNPDRLQKTAVSAMKQSQQAFLPETDKTVSFLEFIAQPFNGRKFIAHCRNTAKKTLAQLYKKGENALILIGPEGDFSEEEVRRAVENGFEPVSLGKNRLRTETACLAAVHTVHVVNTI